MRRVLSVALLGVAVFIGTLMIPGGRASAVPAPDKVVVTNVPLPVTVAGPRPFVGRESLTLPDGANGGVGDGSFVAPAGAVMETVSVRIVLPAGQQPEFSLVVPNNSGVQIGQIRVPLQLQSSFPGTNDAYVGTVTNIHAPMGTTTAQPVTFTIGRNSSSGNAFAEVTVTGIPGS